MSNSSSTLPTTSLYLPGAEQARQNVAVGIVVAFTIIGLMCVALRVYTRALIVRNMGKEDWTMIMAATLTFIFSIQLLVMASKYALGFSGSSLSPSQVVSSIKMGLAIIVVYKTAVTLIKVSILLIYLRLSVSKTFEWLCKGSIYLLMTYQAIVILLVPLECIPLRMLWDLTVPGRCINTAVFYYITSGFHIFMDVWILILPCRFIFSIPRPTREKTAVYAVFGLGAFSTICSIIRFRYLVLVYNTEDPYYESLNINIWSVVELNVGIICASVPTLRPLFSRTQRSRTRQALKLDDEEDSLPYQSRRGGLLQAKEMFITITAMTFRSNKDSTFNDEATQYDDRPPPVPPKDEKSLPTAIYSQTAYQKF